MATKTREEKRNTFAWQGKDKSGNLRARARSTPGI